MYEPRIICPSEFTPDEEWDDTICYGCLEPLAESEPENTLDAALWDEGFCSQACKERIEKNERKQN